MSIPTKRTIAFFGATGGCAAATLAAALRGEHTCIALARNPQKLTMLLTSAPHSIPKSVLTTQLTIVKGDIRNLGDVAKVLVKPESVGKGVEEVVDTIISGIGSYPEFQFSLHPFTLKDPGICEDGMKTVLEALSSLQDSSERGVFKEMDGKRPLVVAISSTGTNARTRDVPLLLTPLYHWLGAVPHADKRAMESLLFNSSICSFVIIRPSLLIDGAALGVDKVRAGWEEEEKGPAVGWTISRRDVGGWIYEEVVKREGGGGWRGKCISLTY
ncbi:hypothetical protein GQ43DRAFT_424123 [Delitschia confertaspora ATCC 74209]|uniref:NAD(P)-binding domain-containing protein n=1 Tax=Delitschia confertaspora ATCC 74209 TaxID=1513339 RepID=A0A9P4JI62_9PLEO|nr:hypothetical protein GQ43DRAFT_424123 [Delitschia confertaspora ATCC 74209]